MSALSKKTTGRATEIVLPQAMADVREVERRDIVARIWRRDHTVWKPDPAEIADRLGWLTVTGEMRRQAPALEAFGREIKAAGYRHVVLLGMGGSSLGPEVLRGAFDSRRGDPVGRPRADDGAAGYPTLIVLDSTAPAWVRDVTDSIDPARTLFLVSSKSGGTIEPLSFYKHFRALVERARGQGNAGPSFVAITDPGTSLERMARQQGFRRVFLNPPDIGGRYSVLSLFGLVPAALIGIDLGRLLDRADAMAARCRSTTVEQNPGAWLGGVMGGLAAGPNPLAPFPRWEGGTETSPPAPSPSTERGRTDRAARRGDPVGRPSSGRDKLTLITSPGIAGLGLWVEQLIAESTGKEGKGIVPVAGEPLLAPEHYGPDRLFVYVRLEGDDNADLDKGVRRLHEAGHPVVRLDLGDRYDLGAEFFRWEFATAVAGALLGIQPFDQPNVQQAKDLTAKVLREKEQGPRNKEQGAGGTGPRKTSPPSRLPAIHPLPVDGEGAGGEVSSLLEQARPGDYLAVMAYLREKPELDRAFGVLRRKVMETRRIATTLGYGPRFLHSTGQLHKGGPDTGLFLQVTAEHERDLPVPGERYTFGVLADAQAQGDFEALRAQGRRVARVHLDRDDAAGIMKLAEEA